MKTLNDYCLEQFGEKLYKLSLDGGMTCPNRDGKCGTRGCIFCSEGGSGDFTPDKNLSLNEQIEDAKRRVAGKFKGNKYIAYFQAYTNTYAPVDYLRKLFSETINRNDIAVLSIATRPDCLPDEVIELLRELNTIKPVWVELGLQTSKMESIKYTRRGYDNSVYAEAVNKLKNIGIHVITHIILGLPGETAEDMKNTVRFAVSCGTDGIKLQLLHVLKGTDLALDFERGMFKVMSLEEYIDILIQCLSLIPEEVVIHRLTGDGPKKILVAPLWSADKKRTINAIYKAVAGKK